MFKDNLNNLKRRIDWLKRVLKLNARNITGNPRDTISELFVNQGTKYATELSAASQELSRRINAKTSGKSTRGGKKFGKTSEKSSRARPKGRSRNSSK